jgi:prepilin signal peptidase PulO-like enzyme (type II secretory pathway)
VQSFLYWKHSRISMFEVEALPQSCIPYIQIGLIIAMYKRSSLLVENSELRPSSQHILVSVPVVSILQICVWPGKSPVKVSRRQLTSLSWGSCMLFILTGGGGGEVSLHLGNLT